MQYTAELGVVIVGALYSRVSLRTLSLQPGALNWFETKRREARSTRGLSHSAGAPERGHPTFLQLGLGCLQRSERILRLATRHKLLTMKGVSPSPSCCD